MSAKSARSKVAHLSLVGRIKQRLSWLEHAGKITIIRGIHRAYLTCKIMN